MSDIVIRNITPAIDGGRFPVKAIQGDVIEVRANVFTAGADPITVVLRCRKEGIEWTETRMFETGQDCWTGRNSADSTGLWVFQIEAWPVASGRGSSHFSPEMKVFVDPPLSQFSAWYQLFPRSCGSEAGRHGTLRDVALRLPVIAAMGFDVVYLTPIHPIGLANRKGRNGSLCAVERDPGSPWAIGSRDGGHKSVHPELGTLEDLRLLLRCGRELSLEIALDIALQCSPDHPYVAAHPNWFRRDSHGGFIHGADGPSLYQDVYPFDFNCPDRKSLWDELKSVFIFWIEQGIRVFRVDNPHTKPFDFWEWLITDLRRRCPNLVLLAEGLTRPEPMIHLGRIGFNLSYDYFPWRNSKDELIAYYRYLACEPMRNCFRPCLWPNTPQCLPESLQFGGVANFAVRFILAATLGASYGIYGPAFELCTAGALPDTSEYLNSEQFELTQWDWGESSGLRPFIARVNRIRKSNPAFESNATLTFHDFSNARMVVFSKRRGSNRVLVAVNLNPHGEESGWTTLNLDVLGLDHSMSYVVRDLLTGTEYHWHGVRNYISLNPNTAVAHVFLVLGI